MPGDSSKDLSFPFNHSVKDGILKSELPVSYSKVDDAINMIVKGGGGGGGGGGRRANGKDRTHIV